MDAGSEGEVRGAVGAGGVESVRMLVGPGVPVGGADQRDDLLAGAHQLTLELDWFQRDPAGPLDRRRGPDVLGVLGVWGAAAGEIAGTVPLCAYSDRCVHGRT